MNPQGGGRVAWWVEYLSHNHEDLSSVPRHPRKKSFVAAHACVPALVLPCAKGQGLETRI